MKNKLPSFPPNEATIITDDADAYFHANAFQMLSQAFLESPLPATFIISPHHDTHWLVVILNKGYSTPSENGMSFYAIPKKLMSLDKVKSMIHSQCEGSYVELENSAKPEG